VQAKADLERLTMAPAPTEAGLVLGQLLFTLANLARILGIDAEGALREANMRFERHFRQTERGGR